jgi:hypothetical protein
MSMAKFSGTQTTKVTSLVRATAPAQTHEGGQGWTRDAKSDLFLLAVTSMVGEDSFYESAGERDQRLRELVEQVTVSDPDWVAGFVPFLRNQANMRSASVVVAAESARARITYREELRAKTHTSTTRRLVASALQRADEPAEFIGYWSKRFGRTLPGGVQRGLADAVTRLYNQYTAGKYDGLSRAIRMGDVIELVHPTPKDDTQSDLFRYLLDRRHHPDSRRATLSRLPMIQANLVLEEIPVAERRSVLANSSLIGERFQLAGFTWEELSGWLNGPMDAQAWEAIIPSMGYMALLRNLRNFDEAGVSDAVAAQVIDRLADRVAVMGSRQFPFRFYAAYQAAQNLRWANALEQALNYSVRNIPQLPGRSLVLVDTSASMSDSSHSKRSKMRPVDAAALFGVALAFRCGTVDLFGFADGTFRHQLPAGGSVLPQLEAFTQRIGESGHGTNIPGALAKWDGHDRVFLITDMQTMASYDGGFRTYGGYGGGPAPRIRVPESVPVYGFNLGGYATTVIESGVANRYEFGGLSDITFRMVPLLEAGRGADWDELFA